MPTLQLVRLPDMPPAAVPLRLSGRLWGVCRPVAVLQPFFEADLPGCVLRIVPNMGPNTQQRSQQPPYMLVRVEGVVQRNSYG